MIVFCEVQLTQWGKNYEYWRFVVYRRNSLCYSSDLDLFNHQWQTAFFRDKRQRENTNGTHDYLISATPSKQPVTITKIKISGAKFTPEQNDPSILKVEEQQLICEWKIPVESRFAHPSIWIMVQSPTDFDPDASLSKIQISLKTSSMFLNAMYMVMQRPAKLIKTHKSWNSTVLIT